MANQIYNSFKKDVMIGNINLSADTVKLMLVTDAYVPNIDTHAKRSDITNEVVGAGYTAGGVVLAGKTVTINNTTDKAVFAASNVSIPAVTIAAKGAVLYKSRGGVASADEIIKYIDFGAVITSTAGNFDIAFDVNGIISL